MAQRLGGGGLEGQRSLDLDRYAFFGAQRLGGLGWRVKGFWIWTGMHFLGRNLTSLEGSCKRPKALGGLGWRLDLDRYAFFWAKTDVL